VLLADLDVLDREIAARTDDLVQHFRENQRVDDMPFDLDFFSDHAVRLLTVHPKPV